MRQFFPLGPCLARVACSNARILHHDDDCFLGWHALPLSLGLVSCTRGPLHPIPCPLPPSPIIPGLAFAAFLAKAPFFSAFESGGWEGLHANPSSRMLPPHCHPGLCSRGVLLPL